MAVSEEMDEAAKEAFRQQFCKDLIGQECWSIVAGEGTGTMVSIDFGRKFPLKRPVNNRHLSYEQQHHSGEYSIFIQFAAWWVFENDEEIGGWEDHNSNDGVMVASLKRLVGKKVLEIDFYGKEYGFVITFEEHLKIRVQGVDYDDGEEYTDFTFFQDFLDDSETFLDDKKTIWD